MFILEYPNPIAKGVKRKSDAMYLYLIVQANRDEQLSRFAGASLLCL